MRTFFNLSRRGRLSRRYVSAMAWKELTTSSGPFGEEAFVKARAEVPVIALVIFVAIKSPDAAYDDERN